MDTCKSCWWQEGGQCYQGNPKVNKNGRSIKKADQLCDQYLNKRKALSEIIPSEKLIILSERRNK